MVRGVYVDFRKKKKFLSYFAKKGILYCSIALTTKLLQSDNAKKIYGRFSKIGTNGKGGV